MRNGMGAGESLRARGTVFYGSWEVEIKPKFVPVRMFLFYPPEVRQVECTVVLVCSIICFFRVSQDPVNISSLIRMTMDFVLELPRIPLWS